jgi:hypothetical protein
MTGSLVAPRDADNHAADYAAPATSAPLLAVSGLSISYGRVRALDGIDLTVRRHPRTARASCRCLPLRETAVA